MPNQWSPVYSTQRQEAEERFGITAIRDVGTAQSNVFYPNLRGGYAGEVAKYWVKELRRAEPFFGFPGVAGSNWNKIYGAVNGWANRYGPLSGRAFETISGADARNFWDDMKQALLILPTAGIVSSRWELTKDAAAHGLQSVLPSGPNFLLYALVAVGVYAFMRSR